MGLLPVARTGYLRMSRGARSSTLSPMYTDHMNGWWAWMAIWPLVWIVLIGLAVYIAVRLGIRDSKRDQS